MNGGLALFLSFVLALINQFNFSLESAFLQNDPASLAQLLPSDSPVLLTLPEPFQVSDCFSREQAFQILKRLFQHGSTLEFFVDQENQPVLDRRGAIIQARWSASDKRDGRKHLFRVYFYIFPERPSDRKTGEPLLKIREIRAEKR
ncbi:MAG: hypothetical protein NUW07_03650 [Candidatus Saccharicenans sp.]|nr:hypothetical protein [Candidatus Saccharicenans sp.]MDH7492598.1 hypothetical protein [Candidatus Saccharicenans sp.]